MPQTKTNESDAPAVQDADAWMMQTVPRVAAPPLRFKGVLASTHRDGPLFITLWHRKKGDFVVAYSYVDLGEAAPHAFVAADLAEAVDLLESLCDPATAAADLSSLSLGALVQSLGHQQRFEHLVGAALAAWDAQMHPTPEPV